MCALESHDGGLALAGSPRSLSQFSPMVRRHGLWHCRCTRSGGDQRDDCKLIVAEVNRLVSGVGQVDRRGGLSLVGTMWSVGKCVVARRGSEPGWWV